MAQVFTRQHSRHLGFIHMLATGLPGSGSPTCAAPTHREGPGGPRSSPPELINRPGHHQLGPTLEDLLQHGPWSSSQQGYPRIQLPWVEQDSLPVTQVVRDSTPVSQRGDGPAGHILGYLSSRSAQPQQHPGDHVAVAMAIPPRPAPHLAPACPLRPRQCPSWGVWLQQLLANRRHVPKTALLPAMSEDLVQSPTSCSHPQRQQVAWVLKPLPPIGGLRPSPGFLISGGPWLTWALRSESADEQSFSALHSPKVKILDF